MILHNLPFLNAPATYIACFRENESHLNCFLVHCFAIAIFVLIACLPAMSCDSCTCDVTCSPYQANSSVQINLLQHPKVDWYKTHSILAYSLLTHLTCVKLFKAFQSLSHIAHCNWNSGVSHAICHWNSHEALPFHPVITCVIAVCNVGLKTLKQLYTLQ